ncbi:MAG: formyl-CoA transferase [Rhodospirillaceae bacterium]|jgi:formyl-CoA transferase|nr:formyl-CoA transferase [Rhodospirillaceae bacterium]MDP6644279.1 CoA transferase [Rhodospirillales bacterium]
MTRSALPLSRFKVLDLTRARSGPTCVRQLADWGADVIKIEEPAALGDAFTGSRESSDFQNLHRNKRAMTLNLKAPEGKEIFMKLAAAADVVVENYRPDVKNRLGIDYDSLRAVNKGIVLASISGFGQDGPYANRPGYDQVAQGMGGLMSVTGLPGQGPVRAGFAITDTTAGLFCSMGILAALLEREVSGEGQWVDSSLLAASIAILDFQAARWTVDGVVPPQAGNNHPTGMPTGMFETSDGFMNIAATGDVMFGRLCEALGSEELLEDERFTDGPARSKNRDEIHAAISAYTRTRSTGEWVEKLNQAGVPSGPVYSIDQTFNDPQVKHLGMAAAVDHPTRGRIELVGQPVRFHRTPWQMRTAAAELGEHTEAILAELGYSGADIEGLRMREVF